MLDQDDKAQRAELELCHHYLATAHRENILLRRKLVRPPSQDAATQTEPRPTLQSHGIHASFPSTTISMELTIIEDRPVPSASADALPLPAASAQLADTCTAASGAVCGPQPPLVADSVEATRCSHPCRDSALIGTASGPKGHSKAGFHHLPVQHLITSLPRRTL